MFKKVLLFCLLFFIFANVVSAHTGLEASFPKDGEVITEQVHEILLSFNTKIEQGSTYELSAVSGDVIPLTAITLNENQMKGTIQQPLDNGEYIVKWNIIGADGHPIEGTFTFFVEINQAEDVKEDPIDEEKELKGDTNSTPPSSNQLPETENQQQSLPLSILLIMLVIMSLIFVGTFIIIFKRTS